MDIFKEDLLKRRFDQILGFLNDLVKHELFVNIKYGEYVKAKTKTKAKEKKVSPGVQENFDNIIGFLEKVNSFKITNELLRRLEFEYCSMKNEEALNFDKSNLTKRAVS